ncbi:protocadherin gamma-C3-like isoform X14 [Scleropages formosus]|uniref:protocadherin gamma-C3-like isoform X14 n=1 Tax=Scleropages formosus TaxID=113540 RepID=UPI0010FA7F0C|nr:protocadherin gamma-C3-like isoform X14 [Scleropages formosus]
MITMEKTRRRSELEHRWMLVNVMAVLCLYNAARAQIKYSIPEEVKEGSVVGNIAKDLGIEVGALGGRRFRVVSGTKESPFQVNDNDGILYLNQKIDREEICDRENSCIVNLKTVMENPLEVHYVAVEILDINDHSPRFSSSEMHLEIAESALPGARFQLQAARDQDVGVNSIQAYKLSQNVHFRLEVKDRGTDNKIPFLILQKQLDRETSKRHNLVLTASDGGKPPNSGTINIAIEVLDVNDNMPVFAKDFYAATLQENAPLGTRVIQVNATDLDDGSNGKVFYSFGNNINDKIRQIFNLDENTGEITVKGEIDFEEYNLYEIDIQASDKGATPLTVDSSVIVTIIDVNDNAPEIDVTSFSSTISEDSRTGTVIALISTRDIDADLNGKVFCSLPDDVPFKLDTTLQENVYSLVTKALLDREEQSQYDVRILAHDGGEPSLSSLKNIIVHISDVNDNKPEFISIPYSFYVYENNVPGSIIFSVSALDRDQNENAIVKYGIRKDGSSENHLASYLNINPDDGNIYALKSFDFESAKTFQFQVVATDSGTPSLSSSVTVKVFILDKNDNAPVILSSVNTNGSTEFVEEIPRNVISGHLVTKVRAYDPDIGYNGWLSFSLLQVTDPTLFGLERYTGQIRTLRPFMESDKAEHKLVVLVKDNGNVSLSATATVIVRVVETSKEAFVASDVKSAVKNEEENNVTFYLIISLGSVSALFVISIIGLIVMQCSKPRDESPKFSRDSNYVDTSGNGTLCHSIQYRSGEKRYMLVGPRMSIGSTVDPYSNANTLVVPDQRRTITGENLSLHRLQQKDMI